MSTGPGAVLDTGTVVQTVALQVLPESPGGGQSGGTVALEVSLDGETWMQAAESINEPGSIFSASVVARYVRANCTSLNSGVAITAWVAAVVPPGSPSSLTFSY